MLGFQGTLMPRNRGYFNPNILTSARVAPKAAMPPSVAPAPVALAEAKGGEDGDDETGDGDDASDRIVAEDSEDADDVEDSEEVKQATGRREGATRRVEDLEGS